MQSNRINIGLLIAVLFVTLSVASFSIAQTNTDESSGRNSQSEDERLSIMLSERRNELNERLTKLRAIKASMGENHPTLEKVNKQIADAERESNLWATPVDELLSMSDQEVRSLVIRLALRVDQLEHQVNSLKISSQPSRPASIGLGQRPR